MTTPSTPLQATLAGLQASRENVADAYQKLGLAIAAHLAAMVRETFPTAVAVVIEFPEGRLSPVTLDSVLGPAPSAIAINPTLYDNSGDAEEDDSAPDDPWPYAIETIEDLAEEYASITHTHNWPWCDTDGRFRVLNFPEPNDTEPEKPQVDG